MLSVSPFDAQLLVQSAGVLFTKQEFESRQVTSKIDGVLSERNSGNSSRKELYISTETCKMTREMRSLKSWMCRNT